MAFELVEEVLDHAPAELGATETLILVAIAEKARKGSRCADVSSVELARRARVSPDGLKKALQRLRKRGMDLRKVIGEDKIGRPIYAVPGRVSSYQIPVFEPPENCSCHRCAKGGIIALLPEKEGRPYPRGGNPVPLRGDARPVRGDGRPPHPSGETEGLSPDQNENRAALAAGANDSEVMDQQTAMAKIRAINSRSRRRSRPS